MLEGGGGEGRVSSFVIVQPSVVRTRVRWITGMVQIFFKESFVCYLCIFRTESRTQDVCRGGGGVTCV